MRLTLLLLIVLAAALAVSGSAAVSPAVVASVTDGDTVRLPDGRRVRFVQIDTPEIGTGECYSRASKKALLRLGARTERRRLEAEPALDQVDRFGRLLRYLWRGGANVNLQLVRQGAAAPYFYGGDLGRYANRLLSAAKAAKAARRGLWGACPERSSIHFARWRRVKRTRHPAASFRVAAAIPRIPPRASRPFRPTSTAPMSHTSASMSAPPHGFDGNRDGVGCET